MVRNRAKIRRILQEYYYAQDAIEKSVQRIGKSGKISPGIAENLKYNTHRALLLAQEYFLWNSISDNPEDFRSEALEMWGRSMSYLEDALKYLKSSKDPLVRESREQILNTFQIYSAGIPLFQEHREERQAQGGKGFTSWSVYR